MIFKNSLYSGKVRVATEINMILREIQTIDGILLEIDDLVLVKDQTNKIENGIYVVGLDTWVRVNSIKDGVNVSGIFAYVKEGLNNSDKLFFCINECNFDKIGTNDIIFSDTTPNVLSANKIITKNGCNIGMNSGSSNTIGSVNGYSNVYIGKGSDSYVEIGSGLYSLVNIGEGDGSLVDVGRSNYSKITVGKHNGKIGFYGKDAIDQPNAIDYSDTSVESLKTSVNNIIDVLKNFGLLKS